jgi:hypothetical protein
MNVENLTFSDALELLKDRVPIRRKHWEKTDRYLYINEEMKNGNPPGIIMVHEENDPPFVWKSSQADLLATDWEIVLEENIKRLKLYCCDNGNGSAVYVWAKNSKDAAKFTGHRFHVKAVIPKEGETAGFESY